MRRRSDVEPNVVAVATARDRDKELVVRGVVVSAQRAVGKELDVEAPGKRIRRSVDLGYRCRELRVGWLA